MTRHRWLLVTAAWLGLMVADILASLGRDHATAWTAWTIVNDTFAFWAGALAMFFAWKETPDAR